MIASTVSNAFASTVSNTINTSSALASTVTNTASTVTNALASTVSNTVTTSTALASSVTNTVTNSTTALASNVTNTLLSNTLKVQHHLRIRLRRQRAKAAWASRLTAPSIEIDLSISCQKLPKKNSFAHADSFCVLSSVPGSYVSRDKTRKPSSLPEKHEKEIGRTEIVRESKDPSFSTTFRLDYRFQEEQTYIMRVYDEDLRYATDLKEHDYLGGAIFTLGELVGSNGGTLCKPLENGKALMVLHAEEIVETRDVLEFRLSCQDLVNMEGVLDLSDPYFQLERLKDIDKSWDIVWKSEVVTKTLSPTWNLARLPVQLLCNGDLKNPLKISIWDYHHNGSHAPLGFVETSVEELVNEASNGIPVFDVLKEKKRLLRGTKLKKSGFLKVLKTSVINVPSMLQYINGGCELNLMVAVDCTTKNGPLHSEDSLHHRSPHWLNDYQAVITKLGAIVEHYGTSRRFATWGFGGRVKKVERDFFQLGETEEVKGAKGMLAAYDHCMDDLNFELGETAQINPVIQAAMYRAIHHASGGQQCYSVLCILVASEISDIPETINMLCTAAEDAPLSVIIIGIGGERFSSLERLAGDSSGTLHDSRGVPIARDILQFASFNQFSGNASDLAAEVLRDIPEQMVNFFTNSGMKPHPPVTPKLSVERTRPAEKPKSKSQPSLKQKMQMEKAFSISIKNNVKGGMKKPKKMKSVRTLDDGHTDVIKKKKKNAGLKRRASETNLIKSLS